MGIVNLFIANYRYITNLTMKTRDISLGYNLFITGGAPGHHRCRGNPQPMGHPPSWIKEAWPVLRVGVGSNLAWQAGKPGDILGIQLHVYNIVYTYIHINTYITYTYCFIMMMMMMILPQNESLSRPNLWWLPILETIPTSELWTTNELLICWSSRILKPLNKTQGSWSLSLRPCFMVKFLGMSF